MNYNEENQLARYENSASGSSTRWWEAKQNKVFTSKDQLENLTEDRRFHFQNQQRCKLPRSIS